LVNKGLSPKVTDKKSGEKRDDNKYWQAKTVEDGN
jgi:hypothetical protein